MKTSLKPSKTWRCSFLIAVAIAALGPVETAWAAGNGKRVLILYSTSRDAPMADAGERELPPILEDGLEEELTHFSEYIDQGRFPDVGYQTALRDFLRVKYGGMRVDLIIAIQAAAIDFVIQHRDEVFPDTPVVFLALSPPAHRPANSTGVIANLDLASTLSLAVALQPELQHVFVVSGTGVPDKGYEREARVQLKPFESRLAITYLSGLVTKDLEARLVTLPERSIVYYLAVYQDGAGEAYSPMAYSDRISALARAPTYTWSDALIDHGVLGGSLLDRRAMMESVGKLAVRVLHGERADSLPTSSPNVNVNQVDWRQLRRWGISEARVPAGTLVRFRELSVWDQYQIYILTALAILLAQAALIAGLLVQRTKRQEAEDQVRGSYVRIRDLGVRLLNSQETERARIARELHDDIGQQMALMTIDLELMGSATQPASETLAAEALTRAHDISRSLHDLSHRLHPAKLRLIGLVTALQSLRHELSRADIVITFKHDNVPSVLPPDLTLCLYRIVQEALQNAIKYSRAHEVSVDLRGNQKEILLVIKDDGIGFDVGAVRGSGLGLISMRERLEGIGGTLAIHSKPGSGTRLDVSVPLSVS